VDFQFVDEPFQRGALQEQRHGDDPEGEEDDDVPPPPPEESTPLEASSALPETPAFSRSPTEDYLDVTVG
jgi:hypothetical protein